MRICAVVFVLLCAVCATGSAQDVEDPTLDLPVVPPVYRPPGAVATPPAPPTPPLPQPVPQPVDAGDKQPPAQGGTSEDPRDLPPPLFFGEEIQSETDSIYYVIDISGSMGGGNQSYMTVDGAIASGPRIDRAKAELCRSIAGLSPNFKFNIVAYDCGTLMWQPTMLIASPGNKQDATAWVRFLFPGGATGTGPATALALAARDNQSVVLLTDGEPNCGADGVEGHRQMIRNNNTQGARISVFGISATGTYRQFCQNVAADSGGSYFDVP